eukprot:7211452-Pyramimonas_sp.AAC.1
MDKQTTIPFLGALKTRQVQEMRGEAKGRLQSWLRVELHPVSMILLISVDMLTLFRLGYPV